MAVAVWHSDDGDVFCAVGNSVVALYVVVGLRCSFSVVAVGVQ